MTRDLATIGIIATILALFFAIPFSVLANLLTPSVRSWWIGRSQTKIKKRLDAINKELARIDARKPDDFRDVILKALVLIVILVAQIMATSWTTTLVVMNIYSKAEPSSLDLAVTKQVLTGLLLLSVLVIILQMFASSQLLLALISFRPWYRTKLREEKTKLELSFRP